MKTNELSARWGRVSKKEQRFLLILGACLLLGISLMCWGRGEEGSSPALGQQSGTEDGDALLPTFDGEEDPLEIKLEELLCQVKGAGQVQVVLRYADSGTAAYAYDSSSRSVTGEGNSTVDTETRLVEMDQQPVLLSTSSPQVQGVLVVAEGGGDPLVQERLYQALRSLLGINAGQIAILEAEGSIDHEY